MDMNKVTVEDCIGKFESEGKVTIINDGKVVGFASEQEA